MALVTQTLVYSVVMKTPDSYKLLKNWRRSKKELKKWSLKAIENAL